MSFQRRAKKGEDKDKSENDEEQWQGSERMEGGEEDLCRTLDSSKGR